MAEQDIDVTEGSGNSHPIPKHTQIEWQNKEHEALRQIIDAKKKTGLTYKQLLHLAAVAVDRSSEDELKSLIGEVQIRFQ
jgi:hypothetical protein